MKRKSARKLTVLMAVASMLSAGMVVHAEPKVMDDGTIFDAEYYAQTYADVVAVYGTEESSLYRHYMEHGKEENRQAVALPDKSVFDPEYYAAIYPDVVAAYGTNGYSLYQHYLQYGKNEGRIPSASATTTNPETNHASAETAPASVETPVANNMSVEEAVQIWQNLWQTGAYINYFSNDILAFFDENGDYNIDSDEVRFLHDWSAYNYDTNKSIDNRVYGAFDAQEIITAAIDIQNGTLKTGPLRKVEYTGRIWLIH